MNKFKIIPADSFIWNQNQLVEFLNNNQEKDILIDTNEEGCCLDAIGLYKLLDNFKFKSVTIKTNNIFETHDRYKIIGNKFFKFFESGHADYSKYWKWNQEKVFGIFYNRPIWHRIGLFSNLFVDYHQQTLFNFRANPCDEDERSFFELEKLFQYSPESVKKFFQVYNELPIQLEDKDGYTVGATTQQHTNQLCEFYPNIFIDVVAETFVQGRTFFVTEKTIRPILLKKPFIIMGPKCFLIHLRQMGFKTFNDFWDEDYDGFDPSKKYSLILKLIKTLSEKTPEELSYMYKNMHEILEHNHNILVNKQFNTKIQYVN